MFDYQKFLMTRDLIPTLLLKGEGLMNNNDLVLIFEPDIVIYRFTVSRSLFFQERPVHLWRSFE
jgi:hypothetical protein